jgi:DNA-binding beta-propeller fold protein YncE
MMHPDTLQLAAYLDGALDPQSQAELRAHILTCAACAARLERLRADARRIATTLSASGAAPDVRAAVRARLRRPAPGVWLARGGALAGALVALLLFAVLVGARGGNTIGRVPDRLFVLDRQGNQLVVVDPLNGLRLGATAIGGAPRTIVYDEWRDRLYISTNQSIVAVDARTLGLLGRWDAPQPFDADVAMALDAERGRLYVAQPGGVVALDLDAPEMAQTRVYEVKGKLVALALAPDGQTIYALDDDKATLWTIDVARGDGASRTLDRSNSRQGWLSISPDGQSLYVLLTYSSHDDLPALWRIDAHSDQAVGPTTLAMSPPPWDMVLLDAGRLAVARGDGVRGGVEIISTDSLSTTFRLDPGYDQHHLAVGVNGAIFGLNFTHNTVTRFDITTQRMTWRTPERGKWQPWEGVFVRGGWHWPW